MRRRSCALLLLFCVLLWHGSAVARDLFSAGISVGGGPATTVGTNKARQIPGFFSDASLTQIEPGYDATQAVAASLDLRGLASTASFDAFSSTLRLQVPGAGIDVSFDGATREEARAKLEAWLEGDSNDALAPERAATLLVQALVANSPVDPVAGNPNSLQSRMFGADWALGTRGAVGSYGDGGILPVGFRMLTGGGYTAADGFDVYSIDVPLQFRAGLGERFAVLVDVPLSATTVSGAWSGLGSAGLGLRVMPTPWWALTPAARIGAVGSPDVGGAAILYSGTLTSEVAIPFGPLALGIANMGGVASSVDGVDFAGYALDYALTNYVVRNGGFLEGDLGSDLLGTGIGWRIGASDVRFFGDDLYMDDYQEIAAGLGAGLPLFGVRLELAYLTGRNTQGVSGRIGLRF